MAQFYARVFVQILDSSIAEDFMVRHVFEDMLKVCDMSGIVDMTRTAMSRRFNVPLEELNRCIAKLEGPDPHSRDEEFDGRRLERLDEHRDWGWRILNWAKYEAIRTRADVAIRVARHRASHRKEEPGESAPNGTTPAGAGKERVPPLARVRGTNRPKSLQEVIQAGSMLGMEESACKKFWEHYEGRAKEDENGNSVWITGPEERYVIVGNWRPLLATWKSNDEERKAKEKAGGRTPREAVREPGPAPTPAPIINQ